MPAPLTADVLVIGGGLAGARAAQAATDAGADTLLVTKAPLGSGGASARASGGFAAAVGKDDRALDHADDTLAGGRGVNDARLVDLITENAPGALDRLQRQVEGFAEVPQPAPLHQRARSVQYERGMTHLMARLGQTLASAGSRVVDRHWLIDLTVSGSGRVDGALLYDQDTGAVVACRAAAVVLATGGCGQLFPVTSNGADATGDGYAAALRAGCTLKDMEFIQYTPTAFAAPPGLKGHTIVGTLLTLAEVKLLNAKGERFMERYAPDLTEGADRATLARAIYREVQEGRGTESGAVYLDATAVTPQAFNHHRPGFYDLCMAHGINPCSEPLQTAPAVHTCLGGVKAGPDLEAAENLFVAGEVMAGMHGANRLSSNSLTEANVTGWIAGERAAACAAGREPGGSQQRSDDFELPKPGGVNVADLHHRLQQVMAASAGVEREATSLRAGLDAVAQIGRECETARKTGIDTITGWLGLRNMVLVAEAILGAALQRTESRGAHFRTDHPQPCDEHEHINVCCALEGEALRYHRVPGA